MTATKVGGYHLVTAFLAIAGRDAIGENPAPEQGFGQSQTCRRPNERRPVLDAETIFQGYEAIRTRLPGVDAPREMAVICTALDITYRFDAFVFDAFGVLNSGERLIEDADRLLADLLAPDVKIRVLTNAASHNRTAPIAKFQRPGLRLLDDEIVTSREAVLWGLRLLKIASVFDLEPNFN